MSNKTIETNFRWCYTPYDYLTKQRTYVYHNIEQHFPFLTPNEKPTIGSCCGSALWGKMENCSPVGYRRNGIGIKVFEGKKIDPWKFDPKTKTSGHVVETKNGPLTITIREQW